ncbi:MAG: CpaF family protein [Sneathiella sp.]
MFGRKSDDTPTMVSEEGEEWKGQEPQQSSNQTGSKNAAVSEELVERIRHHFFDLVNPSIAASLSKDDLIGKINKAVMEIVDREKIPLNWREQSQISLDILNDMTGVGPIEILLKDDSITDILVNGPDSIFVERSGQLELTNLKFRDDQHLLGVARRIAVSVGRRIDESSPMVDARLPDGSRVNIIIPPLSVNGTIISVRKFPLNSTSLDDLVEKEAFTQQMADFLKIVAASRLNLLISGGTGSGKTTLLNALSAHIGEKERVVTIEDAAEINLQQQHVISLETRQKSVEGSGEVSQRDLLRNALRMRPDRIIIGEVRGPEAHEMLQAMNTGHDGSMSTIHANSARDALSRLEDLMLSNQLNSNPVIIRKQISSAIDLVVHVVRDFRGHRYVRSISEVMGIEGEVIVSQDIFKFVDENRSDPTVFSGNFIQNSVRLKCMDKVRRYGREVDLKRVMKW